MLKAMREVELEADVTLNTVDSIESFQGDILAGRWDSVLQQVASIRLPKDKSAFLFEQVVLELLEAGERELAREMLRTAEALAHLKMEQPDRHLKLERLCQRNVFVPSDAYEMGANKERRRQELADALAAEVTVVPPSRLLALLGQVRLWPASKCVSYVDGLSHPGTPTLSLSPVAGPPRPGAF